MDRIKKLCAYLDKCVSFADVGCDHGYCTRYMLKNGLCERAVISDISEKCLLKAETLLSDYVKKGVVKSICCNGLQSIDPATEQVLIAGMGGEEILEILKTAYIPKSFVFQPMKNADKLRRYLEKNEVTITADEYFESGGKFYSVIKGVCGGHTSYSKAELYFGKNLNGKITKKYISSEIDKKCLYLQHGLSKTDREKIESELQFFTEVLNGGID